jgi:protein-tyrosine phosphatase
MKSEVRKRGLSGIRCSSAGTGAAGGVPATAHAREAARKLGTTLSGFRSRPLTPARLARADVILTMTRQQRRDICSMWPHVLDKTHVLPEFTGSGRQAIADPIGGPESAYLECATQLADEIRMLLPMLGPLRQARGRRTQRGTN